MDNSKKITIAVLGGLAIAGIGYFIYSYVKNSGTTAGISNPSHLSVPTGASTAAALQAANPNATNAQIAALLTQLQKQQSSQQQAKGGAPPSFNGGSGGTGSQTGTGNGFVNGVRKNADGSVDKDNGNGTYTETEKDGTTTTYTASGIAIGDGDKIAFDSSGNMVVQHDNGDGTYTESEKDGTTTVYVSQTGQALGSGDVYQNTKSGLAYDPTTDTYFDPNSQTYTDSNGNDVTAQVTGSIDNSSTASADTSNYTNVDDTGNDIYG